MKKKSVALYSRCSTTQQVHSINNQRSALKSYCEARDFEIKFDIEDSGYSGTTDKRPGLKELLKLARERQIDCIVVLKLDRLFRSLKHMIVTLDEFSDLGVEFISVKDQIDASTASGKLLMGVIACMAAFEADLLKERTVLGLEMAKKRGKILGRPKHNMEERIKELRKQGLTYKKIQETLNCSKGSVWRALKDAP